jgi:nucleotide-binding universal stress UspA family protein
LAQLVHRSEAVPIMFKRVLIPTDLTDRTVRALQVAGSLAVTHLPHVTLLHVIETIAGAEFEELSSFYSSMERRARERMNDLIARTPGRQGEIHVAIVYGRRAEEVLRFTRENAIDLIVLASHPVEPSKPSSGLGTMSYKLGILAPCAVLLVK